VIFTETRLKGVYIIDIEPIEDERGFFARSWCRKEFIKRGLNPNLVQCNISYNKKSGIIRGLHYQAAPYGETKLVRCTRGSIYDVIVDIREESKTFRQWFGVELSQENRRMFYIPKGFAHGFQTMEYDTEVFYQMSEFYFPGYARGIRWNDPVVGIVWPGKDLMISEKDMTFPLIEA